MQQHVDKNIAAICYKLAQELLHGHSLTMAMKLSKHEGFFPPLAVALVAAGEESGRLQEMFARLSEYYAEQERLKSFVLKAALYPLLLLGASALVLIFFLLYVLPVLADTYRGLGVRPQGLLLQLLSLQQLIIHHYLMLATGIAALCAVAAYAVKKADVWLLKLPGIGKCFALVYEIRFCQLLAILLGSGLNITHGVPIVAATMENEYCREKLRLFNNRLNRGVDLAGAVSCLEQLLSPMSQELVKVGAATGYLPEMLQEAGAICKEDLHNRLVKIKELLGPVLLFIGALVAGIIVYITLGPMFELISAIPEYS